jgi:hypothetical protein
MPDLEKCSQIFRRASPDLIAISGALRPVLGRGCSVQRESPAWEDAGLSILIGNWEEECRRSPMEPGGGELHR